MVTVKHVLSQITSSKSINNPKPFLKWAGGKTHLLGQLEELFPSSFSGYHEPFIGSGAVYFYIYRTKITNALGGPLKCVWLTDSNEELINCYTIVKKQVDQLIELLNKHREKHSKTYYYEVRAWNPRALDEISRAARFIYLNKTCYNGLYRVNRQGRFNVPIGKYVNPGIVDPENLRKASFALQHTRIASGEFGDIIQRVKSGDFVYLDPPYHTPSRFTNFTAYTQNLFDDDKQRELAEVYRELDRKGCKVMLSNAWTPFIRDLYHGFRLIKVEANRTINSKIKERGKISELVAINYDLNSLSSG